MATYCWSSTFQRLFKPPPDPSYLQNDAQNPRSTHHPSGIIWKKVAIECISADLHLLESVGGAQGGTCPRRETRFVRMQELGLGAVIVYEIPHPTALNGVSERQSNDILGGRRAEWTLKTVFGDPDDPFVSGMDLDDLLNKIKAKLSYVPLYACTSFAMGQAMNASLHNRRMEPRPAFQGFSVDSEAFNLFSRRLTPESEPQHDPPGSPPLLDMSRHLKPTPDAAPRFCRDRSILFPSRQPSSRIGSCSPDLHAPEAMPTDDALVEASEDQEEDVPTPNANDGYRFHAIESSILSAESIQVISTRTTRIEDQDDLLAPCTGADDDGDDFLDAYTSTSPDDIDTHLETEFFSFDSADDETDDSDESLILKDLGPLTPARNKENVSIISVVEKASMADVSYPVDGDNILGDLASVFTNKTFPSNLHTNIDDKENSTGDEDDMREIGVH